MRRLRDFTPARVALGRAGPSVPTRELLDFQLAHARARDAVQQEMDALGLLAEMGGGAILLSSSAPDRETYLRRPDLGRRLSDESRWRLVKSEYDAAFVVVDGLSALAVQRHAALLLGAVMRGLEGWKLAPIKVVERGRVAIGDEIGEALGAALSVVLIGERPGLSSPDSMGVYLTWHPHVGATDAERNCISNIRPEGLSYDLAAHKLVFLMNESRRRKLSGVRLKEEARALTDG
ncbi:MAG: ethanolamine ammonia-lyase subunit EutC [Acidobacteriota bacterium]|nr:ethanolamine ammonia-lyase subunit EutC [Acidobacteriota bacterium]